jgi:hypothetical protein
VAEILSKEALLARRFGVEDVEIVGVGTVQVRPLSRTEALETQGLELSALEMERRLISKAMISPKLTEAEVATWQANSPAGELEPVADRILTLSGMKQESAKEAVKTFRDES